VNIDSGFFYALLRTGDPQRLSQMSRDWIADEWQGVYDFVVECLNAPNMHKMPTPQTIELRFHVEFMETAEDVGYFINALRDRKAVQVLEDGIRDDFMPLVTSTDTEKNNPVDAAEKLMNLGAHVRRTYRPRRQGDFIDYYHDVEVREQAYTERKARQGMMGIPYPFEPMNVATGGLIDGEATAFFAESGVGKTWLLLLCAIHAANKGYSPVLFSNEMQPKRLTIRLDAIMAGVSPERFRRGILTLQEEEKLDAYYKTLAERGKKSAFVIFGPSDINGLASFESILSIIRNDIDVIFWDSPYLCVRSETWEEKTVFVQDLKNMAEDYALPIVVTWQLNRKGEVALTSAITQDFDHNFILGRDSQQKDLAQARLWSLKTRDGLELEDMLLKWNVKEGEFGVLSWKIPGVGSSNENYQVHVDYQHLEGDD